MRELAKNAGRRAVRLAMRPGLVRAPLRAASKGGVLPFAIWSRLPVETAFEVNYPHGITFSYLPTAYDGIGRQLYWAGEHFWEHETVEVFCRLARRARRVLDIGANTGTYSLIACAAHPDTMVTAFEPVPRIRAQLSAAVELNGFTGRCEVRCDAVSCECGTARFHVPAEALPTSSSLHPDGFRGLEGEHIEVPLTSIDALLAEEDAVDLVKIDVEGFEHSVLQGMERTLHQHRPPCSSSATTTARSTPSRPSSPPMDCACTTCAPADPSGSKASAATPATTTATSWLCPPSGRSG